MNAGFSVLVFDVSGSSCALPADAVRETAHIPALMRLPGQPDIVGGFLNYRGQPVPVFPLARLVGLREHEPGLYAPVIFLRSREAAIAVVVDSLSGIARVTDADLQPVPANHTLNDCATAQFSFEDTTVTLLSPDRLLLDEERRRISSLAAQARKRLDDLSRSEPQP